MHAAGKTNWRHLREKTLMRHACAPSRAPPQPPPPPRVYSKYWDFKKGKCEIWSGETRRETGHLKQRRVRLVNKKLIQSPRRSDALSPTYREKENAGSEKRWRAGVRVEGVLLEELGKDFFFYFFFFLCSSRLSLRAATIPDVAHTPQSASVSAWEHRPAGPARHQRPDPALSLSLFPPFFLCPSPPRCANLSSGLYQRPHGCKERALLFKEMWPPEKPATHQDATTGSSPVRTCWVSVAGLTCFITLMSLFPDPSLHRAVCVLSVNLFTTTPEALKMSAEILTIIKIS